MILNSSIGRTVASAVITFACAVACAWPATTEADEFGGPTEDIGSQTTAAGMVRATSRLVEDPNVPGKWYIEVEAKNTSSEAIATAQLEEQILRESMASMMARSGPIPTVAWSMVEKVQVLPNETAIVRHPLPAALSAQIAASRAKPKVNKNGTPMVLARTSYMTRVQSHRVQQASAQAAPPPNAHRVQQASAQSQPAPPNAPSVQQPSAQSKVNPAPNARLVQQPSAQGQAAPPRARNYSSP